MEARGRKRYAAERRFRFLGLLAIGLSVAFLAFLLVTMAWKGLGGFTQTEAKVTIDFPRSDLILDPAALRGPEAEQVVASANLEGVLAQAAIANFGKDAGEMFGGAATRSLGRALIEAVYEKVEAKQALFAALEAILAPDAILATNTSYLNVDEIASATKRPESVIGWHFFSPANVMRLLELVRGDKSSKPVIAMTLR
mgnify:CR=1 FL=1